jgi:hexosaminidase
VTEPVLHSVFDPTTSTITIDLDLASTPVAAGTRLALTSIVQLTPADAGQLVSRLGTYHVFSVGSPGPTGASTVGPLHLSHLPQHANDGPVSAYLIDPDGTTTEIAVPPMRRSGEQPASAVTPATPAPLADTLPLLPHPTSITIGEAAGSHSSLRFEAGPETAGDAWVAIASLEHRLRGTAHLDAEHGTPVTCRADRRLTTEHHRITIDGDRVEVAAADAAGFRHAAATLAQWLPSGLPHTAEIVDGPAFGFRALHVDLARQWFEPDVVLRLIDLAAWRKLSHLHLHLTDDEGWRFEVDAYPQLAEAGRRGHGLTLPPMLGGGPSPSGRAYTAGEIAGWNQRADELGVTLIPEVDFPAHVHAVLAAVPALRDGDDRSGATSVQYFVDNVLVPGHPATEPFVEAAIDAVADLFPHSPYIHIGGDEVPEGAWRGSPIVSDLQRRMGLSSTRQVEADFHRRLVRMIAERHGRRVGSWQEAAESGGVEPGDGYVVGWRTADASRQLAAAGYDVVMSPGEAYYLDMATDDRWDSPGSSWAGSTSLADVIGFEPGAGWTDAERRHLLGIQACVWTEHVHDESALRTMLLPRLDAIAERAWTGTIVGGIASLVARSERVRDSAR